MIRDSLYQQIEQQLKNRLDPEVFQRCAVDLLSTIYPTLAQNLGGNDAGMDGTIGTPSGPGQFIVTTDRDVIGNVRKSIGQRLKRRKGPRTAVVATSQILSSVRKRNIEKAADDLGVRVVNIHDGSDFVGKLYRSALWRKELLGLIGHPPALSVFPPRVRDSVSDELFGREQDLAWLRDTVGDLVICGQPGIGKTCLHEHLAKEGKCLFALDGPDDAELANAIREQSPKVIVVDDAHIRTDLVERLVNLRRVTGGDFAIHANSWPNDARLVAQVLRVPDTNLRRLKLLTRDEVLELIKRRGVFGPNSLLHLIIRDADGKPGLAAALVDSCKKKEVSKVWTGEALVDRLLRHRRGLGDERDNAILAMFSLGGDSGVRMAAVAAALSITESELRARVADLASGGVIQEVGLHALQVRPPGLRAALVKHVFFSGPSSLSFPEGLVVGLIPSAVAHAVLRARQIGGSVDLARVRKVVEGAGDRDTWEHFGFVDEQCARMIIDDYPEQIALAAPGVLREYPEDALRLLFDLDAKDSIGKGSIESPKRRIDEWIVGDQPHDPNTTTRRQQLLAALDAWMRIPSNCDTVTAAWAVAAVIDPRFEFNRQVPGSGDRWEFARGLVSETCLRQIVSLWPRILQLVRLLPTDRRKEVRDRIEDWCFPARHARSALTEVMQKLLHKQARRFLKDVIEIDSSNPALRQWAKKISDWSELHLRVVTDPDFDLLYGESDRASDWQKAWERQVESIEAYAQKLCRSPTESVVSKLTGFERCSEGFEQFRGTGPRGVLYRKMAERVSDPFEWIEAWVSARGSSGGIEPFLARAATERPAHLVPVLERLLRDESYAASAAMIAIQIDEAPHELLTSACGKLETCSRQEGFTALLRNARVSSRVMRFLLMCNEERLPVCAAIAEWQTEPEAKVRPELVELWNEAICRPCDLDHYELPKILKANPSLCFKWLQGKISSRIHKSRYCYGEAWQVAVNSLSRDERRQLLKSFSRENFDSELFDDLVVDDHELLQEWMEGCSQPHMRLRPLLLFSSIDDTWIGRAICALNAGCSPSEVADCCSPACYGANDESIESYYGKQIEFYRRLMVHSDSRLHRSAKEGFETATRRMKGELESREHRKIHGGLE